MCLGQPAGAGESLLPGATICSPPFERRRGLPIGNLTSQFFANLYLNGLDHFCKEVLRAKGYLRYVDDFALFHDDREQLEDWRRRIAEYLEGRRFAPSPAQDCCAGYRPAGPIPRLDPASGRLPAIAGRECASFPQSPAGTARPLARG